MKDHIIVWYSIDPSAAANRWISSRKFVCRRSAGKMACQTLLAVNMFRCRFFASVRTITVKFVDDHVW